MTINDMVRSLRGGFVRSIGGFRRDQRGNFALMFGLTTPALVVLMGMGIDYYVALSDKSRLDVAADAAALAAVNTAKAYFAANSGSQSGTTLQNNAIAAGVAQAKKAFAANLGSTVLAATPTPQISMPPMVNLSFSVTVKYSAQAPAHFGPLIGIPVINISGASGATAGLPKFLDFYVVVDTSGSMGIPTNASDQQLLISTNPDNPIEKANGYAGGCQFACHFVGYQGFDYTQAHNIPLKLNSVGKSVQALLSTATNTAVIANQYRVGIYPFIVNPIVAAPLSANFATANNVAGNLATYLDRGTTNGGMGSGGTHFENLWSGLSPQLATPGTGVSPSSTLPFIILITDGVDNNQVYTPSNGSWTGSQPQVASTTFCASAKAAGYTVAVLLIPYDPIVDPEPIWNNEDGVVNSLISNNTITPAMQNCASPGYFFSAASATQINSAMQKIFFQAVAAARLTQ